MPVPGLSLLGFMPQELARNHLLNQCVPHSTDPAVLDAEWAAAKARLGAPIENAGYPDMRPLPAAAEEHIRQLRAAPWCAAAFAGRLRGCQFMLVELDPLIVHQFTITTERALRHRTVLAQPPQLQQLLDLCLPIAQPKVNFRTFDSPNAMLLKSDSLELRVFHGGIFPGLVLGAQFGVSLPFMQVARHDRRCYLQNGIHRAVGLRSAGLTHAPCIVKDVARSDELGIKSDAGTFELPLLQSANPPTVAHFTRGRAHEVQLRRVARLLQVNWAEYVVPEE